MFTPDLVIFFFMYPEIFTACNDNDSGKNNNSDDNSNL